MKLSKELSRPLKKEKLFKISKKLRKKQKNSNTRGVCYPYIGFSGKEYEEIAKLTDRSKETIVNYIKAYRKGGIEGVNIKPYKGRTPKLTPDQEMCLAPVLVDKTPEVVVFPAKMN